MINLREVFKTPIGEVSDGYHTFNELYHHRAILFSVICNIHPHLAWKSKKHHEGDMYDGMFIVGIETPAGPATYHYDIDPYWDMFKVKELARAPEWDGHTPEDAIGRISTLGSCITASNIKIDVVNASMFYGKEMWSILADGSHDEASEFVKKELAWDLVEQLMRGGYIEFSESYESGIHARQVKASLIVGKENK